MTIALVMLGFPSPTHALDDPGRARRSLASQLESTANAQKAPQQGAAVAKPPELSPTERLQQSGCEVEAPDWFVQYTRYIGSRKPDVLHERRAASLWQKTWTVNLDIDPDACSDAKRGSWTYLAYQLVFSRAACRRQNEINVAFWKAEMWPRGDDDGLPRTAEYVANHYCSRNLNDANVLRVATERLTREWLCVRLAHSVSGFVAFVPGIPALRNEFDTICADVRSGAIEVSEGRYRAGLAVEQVGENMPEHVLASLRAYLNAILPFLGGS